MIIKIPETLTYESAVNTIARILMDGQRSMLIETEIGNVLIEVKPSLSFNRPFWMVPWGNEPLTRLTAKHRHSNIQYYCRIAHPQFNTSCIANLAGVWVMTNLFTMTVFSSNGKIHAASIYGCCGHSKEDEIQDLGIYIWSRFHHANDNVVIHDLVAAEEFKAIAGAWGATARNNACRLINEISKTRTCAASDAFNEMHSDINPKALPNVGKYWVAMIKYVGYIQKDTFEARMNKDVTYADVEAWMKDQPDMTPATFALKILTTKIPHIPGGTDKNLPAPVPGTHDVKGAISNLPAVRMSELEEKG